MEFGYEDEVSEGIAVAWGAQPFRAEMHRLRRLLAETRAELRKAQAPLSRPETAKSITLVPTRTPSVPAPKPSPSIVFMGDFANAASRLDKRVFSIPRNSLADAFKSAFEADEKSRNAFAEMVASVERTQADARRTFLEFQAQSESLTDVFQSFQESHERWRKLTAHNFTLPEVGPRGLAAALGEKTPRS